MPSLRLAPGFPRYTVACFNPFRLLTHDFLYNCTNVCYMKTLLFIFSLLICSMAAVAQDTLKIKGVQKPLVVQISDLVNYNLSYFNLDTKELGEVSVDKIERLTIRSIQLRKKLLEYSYMEKCVKAGMSEVDIQSMGTSPQDSTVDLSWNEHLIQAGNSYNAAVVFASLATVTSVIPLFAINSSQSKTINTVSGVATGLFSLGSLLFYISGNNHIIQAGELARAKNLSLNLNPTGVSLSFRIR